MDEAPMAPASSGSGDRLPPRWQESVESLKNACDSKSLGEIVAANQKMILDYYQDVQKQARMSFVAAWAAAIVGFAVLIGSLAYAMMRDSGPSTSGAILVTPSHILAGIGVASGIIIEFIAFVSFRLYGQASRQFGTFHICLERTNRYLIAYKVADKIIGDRDQTLHDLVCIMANATMIVQPDIESPGLLTPQVPPSAA